MPKPSEKQVRDITEAALEEFWLCVTRQFPAAKSGDLSPERAFSLQGAAKEAIAEWLESNT